MNSWEQPCHGASGRHIWRHMVNDGQGYESCWRCGSPRTEKDQQIKEGAAA